MVKEALLSMDYHPVEQTNFPPDYREVEQVLKEKVASCAAVVHIVGMRYGAEPDPAALPPDSQRRSFTQTEVEIARQLTKKVYVFLCPPEFPYDACEEEPAELQELQKRYRATISDDPHLRSEVDTREALATRVRELQLDLQTLRQDVSRAGQRVLVGAAVMAVLLAVIGAAIWWVNRDVEKVSEGVGKLASDVDQLSTKTAAEVAKLYDDPDALAERMRAGIRKKAELELAAAKQGGAKWQQLRELERRRDQAIEQVDEVIRTIRAGLTDNADPVFSEASRILAEEGVEGTLGYLASHQKDILARVNRLAAREEDLRQRMRRALEPLLLQAELHETNLDWNEALALFESVTSRAPQWSRARLQFGRLLDRLIRYADAQRHLQAAYQFADDEATRLQTSNALGLLYLHKADWKKAEPLFEEHLALCEKLHGADASETATAINNLAQLFQSTNRLVDAERLMRRALAINEKLYGANHLGVTTSLGNLASLLHYTKRISEAEPLMRRALAIDEASLGPAHPNVATDLNNLAQVLLDSNRLAAAELLMRRSLAITEKAYGTDHPALTIDLGNLAQLLKVTGRQKQAEALGRQAFAIDEKALGPDHPQIAVHLNNLAQLLQVTNRLKEAEPLFRRALLITEKANGPTHAAMAIRLNNLAALLHATGRSAEALPLMYRAVVIERKTFGDDQPKVAISMNNFGQVLRAADRLVASETVMRHALAIMEKTYGTESPDVAVGLNALSSSLRNTGRMKIAEPIARRVLVIFRRYEATTGQPHPYIGIAVDNYQSLLAALEFDDGSIAERLASTKQINGELKPFVPALDKLIAPAKTFDDAMAALEAKYKAEAKPAVYTLPLSKPVTPFLDQLLSKSGEDVPLDKPFANELDKLLGVPPSVKQVLDELDGLYREQKRPSVWFLPLTEPISPHLDGLLNEVVH